MLCLYTAALDAGDRFADALLSRDTAAASDALNARAGIVRALAAAGLPPPSVVLKDRFRAQSDRLSRTLDEQLAALGVAVADDARAAAAHRSYRPEERAPRLDTAPRV